MIKKTMLIGMMCVSFFGISQTQCNELTKDSVQCNNTTKAKNSLCYLHNPYYTNAVKIPTTICNGITKKNKPCKRKTKDVSGKCYNHKND
jgi:hypothetical protein